MRNNKKKNKFFSLRIILFSFFRNLNHYLIECKYTISIVYVYPLHIHTYINILYIHTYIYIYKFLKN